MKRFLLLACTAVLAWSAVARAQPVLVTGISGDVVRVPAGSVPSPFSRVGIGAVLRLGEGARLRLLFLDTGREELWQGPGKLAITESSVVAEGLAAVRVRSLPVDVVRRLAMTPRPDTDVADRPPRLRSIPARETIEQIEASYRRMRAESTPDDLGPELFLLAGMMENRQLERVESIIADIIRDRPGDPQGKLLASLYRKSLRNARESGRTEFKSRE